MLNAPLRPRTPDEDTPRELAIRYKQKEVVELIGQCSLPGGYNIYSTPIEHSALGGYNVYSTPVCEIEHSHWVVIMYTALLYVK